MAASIEVPKEASSAGSMEEHRQIRNAQRAGKPITETKTSDSNPKKPKPEAPPPAQSPAPKGEKPVKAAAPEAAKPSAPQGETTPGVPETPSAPKGETAEVSETPSSQEAKPKRDDAESRVADLLESRKADRKRIAELEAQLLTKPSAPAPKAEPVAPQPQPARDPEPDLDVYMKTPVEGDVWPFAKTQAKWSREHTAWALRTERAQQAAQASQETVRQRLGVAIQKHGRDIMQAAMGTAEDPTSGVSLAGNIVGQLIQSYETGWDVLAYLHQNPVEYQRIRALPPAQQFAEVVYLAKTIDQTPHTPAAAAPPLEQPKPQPVPIRTVAPPPRTVSGTSSPEPKTTSEAGSMDEHRRLRQAKLAGERRAG